jgi:hypothetical protein
MARKAVPEEIQLEVLAACRRRCAICFGLHRDMRIKAGQIAHLDRDAANPTLDNLVFLCLEHHDQFDGRTSQSKGLTSEEVRRFRQELAAAVERAIADEHGGFGRSGAGAQPGGEDHRPVPDLTSDRAAQGPAPQRLTIREKSAAEILGSLKGTPSYEFHEKVEELYLGRWTQEPGWKATVSDLPSRLSRGLWFCSLAEVDSSTLVMATTPRDVSSLRPGDPVTVTGRIKDVSLLASVSLEDATLRSDDVPFPESH